MENERRALQPSERRGRSAQQQRRDHDNAARQFPLRSATTSTRALKCTPSQVNAPFITRSSKSRASGVGWAAASMAALLPVSCQTPSGSPQSGGVGTDQ